MRDLSSGQLIGAVRQAVYPLQGKPYDYDPLFDLIGDARIVCIGEASHGTHEFYAQRAQITRRLIEEKGFLAVAVEADWPDAYRLNRYVKGAGDGEEAIDAFSMFTRFPLWMWRNTVVLEFISWLREHNERRGNGAPRAGFYGLDMYSLFTSIEAVINYLERVDPVAAARARHNYSCFEQFAPNSQTYGYWAGLGLAPSCEEAVIHELVDLRQHAQQYVDEGGALAEDDLFNAEMNALVVKSAEEYYRQMFSGRVNTWNLRDQHMFQTLEALTRHFERQGHERPKIVVWAHNSHLGDARATEMGQTGELNVGQLVRQKWGDEARLTGFTTDHGTVTAASEWDAPAERKNVRPALAGSYERLFHQIGIPDFFLNLREDNEAVHLLAKPLLERAIGVIYSPKTERMSHYFYSRLPEQFDAIIHLDDTRALEPIDVTSVWNRGEVPETYPTGI